MKVNNGIIENTAPMQDQNEKKAPNEIKNNGTITRYMNILISM